MSQEEVKAMTGFEFNESQNKAFFSHFFEQEQGRVNSGGLRTGRIELYWGRLAKI